MCQTTVGQGADEDVGADPVGKPVADGADEDVGALHRAEDLLDAGQPLVAAHGLVGRQRVGGLAGADDVDAVEGGLGGDVRLVAPPCQGAVADLRAEVLAHLPAPEGLPDLRADLGGGKGRPGAAGRLRPDPRQPLLGRREQLVALPAPLLAQERVEAGHQALPRIQRRDDLRQIPAVEQGELEPPKSVIPRNRGFPGTGFFIRRLDRQGGR
jgi:hypothetical protein